MKYDFFKKPLVIALALIVALFLAGLIGTPYLIDMGIERWISSRGPEIGKVENIDFNPFSGRLSMDNLVVETTSGRTLSIPHAYLSFSWKQLFKKQLYLKELVLQDAFMLVDRLKESEFRIGGFILSELAGTEKKSDEPGWEVGIGVFEMQSARIEYDTPELVATYFIDNYTLKGLETWNKQKPVQMAYQGRINESEVQVEADVVLLDAAKSWKGSIVLKKGSLELISKVRGLQEYAPSGTIDIDLELDAQMQEDATIVFDAEVSIGLDKLQFQYKGNGLQQNNIAWQGRITGNKTAGRKLAISADGKLATTGLLMDDKVNSLQQQLAAFNWEGKAGFSRQEDASIVFDADGAITMDKLQFQNEGYGLQQEKFSWQGRMEGNSAAERKLAVTVDGKLATNGLLMDDKVNSLQQQLAALNWEGKAGFSRQEDAAIGFDADGELALDKLQLQYKENGLQQEKIVWKGHLAGSKPAEKDLTLEVDGQLAGSGLIHDSRAKSLQMLLGALNWQGTAGISRQGGSLAVTMESTLDGENILVNDQQNKVALLGLEKLNFGGLRIAGLEDIQASGLELQNLLLVEKQNRADKKAKDQAPPLLRTAKIEINNANMQNRNNLSIDNINLEDVAALIRRDKEGDWQFMPASTDGPETKKEQPAPGAGKTNTESGPMTFRINSLQAGGKNSIRFEDESLPRPFRTILHIDEFTLATAGSEPSQFKAKGRIGDYGSVAFDGTVEPGDEPISLDIKGTVSALDMPPFSSYTGKTIGYNVTSGQMDADITMNIDKGMLDSIFDLHMRNLEVARVDPEKMPAIDNQMDVPLEAALAMLRNKKDEINFKLKLKDDIKNPKFGIQDAINQALAKAMKFATLSYLKYTLQPFGTFIAVAEVAGKAGKEMSKVGLDPVTFPAGDIVLDGKASQYLGKVKEVLDNRPKLRIELCGRAVAKDRLALVERRQAAQEKLATKAEKKPESAAAEITVSDEVLLDFARERANLVKESLVNKYSIGHERIFLCLPELDETPDKEPRVELYLD